jgi:hypothetical protein
LRISTTQKQKVLPFAAALIDKYPQDCQVQLMLPAGFWTI